MKNLDMTGIETPVALSSIPKFESQNSTISVNVLVYEKRLNFRIHFKVLQSASPPHKSPCHEGGNSIVTVRFCEPRKAPLD